MIFKSALAVLTRMLPFLLHSRFEDIMSALTSLNNAPVDPFDSDFLPCMSAIKVTNSLLKELEAEYEHIKMRASRPEGHHIL